MLRNNDEWAARSPYSAESAGSAAVSLPALAAADPGIIDLPTGYWRAFADGPTDSAQLYFWLYPADTSDADIKAAFSVVPPGSVVTVSTPTGTDESGKPVKGSMVASLAPHAVPPTFYVPPSGARLAVKSAGTVGSVLRLTRYFG